MYELRWRDSMLAAFVVGAVVGVGSFVLVAFVAVFVISRVHDDLAAMYLALVIVNGPRHVVVAGVVVAALSLTCRHATRRVWWLLAAGLLAAFVLNVTLLSWRGWMSATEASAYIGVAASAVAMVTVIAVLVARWATRSHGASSLGIFLLGAILAPLTVFFLAKPALLLFGALEHGVLDSDFAEIPWSILSFWACSIAGGLIALALGEQAQRVALSSFLGLVAGWGAGLVVAPTAIDIMYSWPVARAATWLALSLLGAALGALAGVWWARRTRRGAADAHDAA